MLNSIRPDIRSGLLSASGGGKIGRQHQGIHDPFDILEGLFWEVNLPRSSFSGYVLPVSVAFFSSQPST